MLVTEIAPPESNFYALDKTPAILVNTRFMYRGLNAL